MLFLLIPFGVIIRQAQATIGRMALIYGLPPARFRRAQARIGWINTENMTPCFARHLKMAHISCMVPV